MAEPQENTPAALGFHMPAEWRPHQSTWLTWPKDPETWPGRVTQVEEIYLEMIAALMPFQEGVLPPTANLTSPDPACAVRHVTKAERGEIPRAVMSNSFAFGGSNVVLIAERA